MTSLEDLEVPIWRAARRIAGADQAWALDLAQEGRLAAWQAWGDWDPSGGPTQAAWAIRRARWAMRSAARQAIRQEQRDQAAPAPATVIAPAVEARLDLADLARAPAQLRSTLAALAQAEGDVGTAAAELGVAPRVLRRRLARARTWAVGIGLVPG